MKKLVTLSAAFLIAACASMGIKQLDELFGPAQVQNRQIEQLTSEHVDYWSEVKPILDNRCVVCHGCYDAPCQIKLGSPEGIDRGGSKEIVYNQARLNSAPMTRLFEDANDTQSWRDKNFYPILNEREQFPVANLQVGVLARSLKLKQTHPLPDDKKLDNDDFTFGVDRKNSCPTIEQYEEFADDNKLWGMPYALPGLEQSEQRIIERWLEQGAKYTARPKLAAKQQQQIQHWETLINDDSLKSQLVARYLYEHLFLANLYFHDDADDTRYFRLVRSSSQPGTEIKPIATRRPYDDPGVERVYYRFVPVLETIVAKTHMPYALNDEREKKWNAWFYQNNFPVSALPGYSIDIAANPFKSFAELPIESRHRFLLDEARFTIMNFIKGPVCRGQVALNVINDHFWVFFINPQVDTEGPLVEMLLSNKDELELPNAAGNAYLPSTWRRYAKKQRHLLDTRATLLKENIDQFPDLGMNIIWDGGGNNDNAALTIFRHNDSATVEKGLLGQAPQTSWVIGYSLLERIHYLLVAGYDVYGNVGHQLYTRMFMDFLRMEGEANFLVMLPQPARNIERDNWYRNADKDVMQYLTSDTEDLIHVKLNLPNADSKAALYQELRKHVEKIESTDYALSQLPLNIQTQLERLQALHGKNTRRFAETSHLQIKHGEKRWYATLLRNNAHLSLTSLFKEDSTLAPDENTMSIVSGLLGVHPNALFSIHLDELSDFVDQALLVESKKDYARLLDAFGVRRTNKDFWHFSDQLHADYKKQNTIDFGLLDYNRLENR